MDTFWIVVVAVIGLFVLLLGVFFVVGLVTDRREFKANHIWADKVNQAGTDDAILAIGDIPYSDDEVIDERITAARSRYKKASETVKTKKEVQECLDELRQREGVRTYEELAVLFDSFIPYAYLNWEDEVYLRDIVERLTKAHAQELYEKARQGNADSLALLAGLVLPDSDAGYSKISPFQEQTGEAYAFPPDWNELIVRLFENPRLGAFVGCERNPAIGAVRLRAAKALRSDLSWEQQLVDAQIVLAYADKRREKQYIWRNEVGPILLAEVSKLVATIHSDQQLVFASTAPTE